jgi:hypothetical protein
MCSPLSVCHPFLLSSSFLTIAAWNHTIHVKISSTVHFIVHHDSCHSFVPCITSHRCQFYGSFYLFCHLKHKLTNYVYIKKMSSCQAIDVQLGLAIDSPKATLAVKRRLACEMVKCWQQVRLIISSFLFSCVWYSEHIRIAQMFALAVGSVQLCILILTVTRICMAFETS